MEEDCGGVVEEVVTVAISPGTGKDYWLEQKFYSACEEGDLTEVKKCVSQGVSTNYQSGGWTGLICAVHYNKTEVAQYLLPLSDININDNSGMTALHWACINNNVKIVKELISDQRMNINQKNNSNDTPVMIAVTSGRLEVVKLLFSHQGLNRNTRDNQGNTLIEEAR